MSWKSTYQPPFANTAYSAALLRSLMTSGSLRSRTARSSTVINSQIDIGSSSNCVGVFRYHAVGRCLKCEDQRSALRLPHVEGDALYIVQELFGGRSTEMVLHEKMGTW